MKHLTLCFLLVFIFCGNISAQNKSAVGTLVSSEGGNRQGVVCLKIKKNTQCFEWGSTGTTKFRGFQNGKAWNIGAEWRITYYYESGDVAVLRTATFTGRIIK